MISFWPSIYFQIFYLMYNLLTNTHSAPPLYFCFGFRFFFWEKKKKTKRKPPNLDFPHLQWEGCLFSLSFLIAFRPLLEREPGNQPTDSIRIRQYFCWENKNKSFRPTVSWWMSAPLALLRPPHFFLFHYLFIDLFESFFVCVCIPY